AMPVTVRVWAPGVSDSASPVAIGVVAASSVAVHEVSPGAQANAADGTDACGYWVPSAGAVTVGCRSKSAVTVVSADSGGTMQVWPVQAPPNPVKADPSAGVAVSVSVSPGANDARHAPAGQSMAPASEVTVPAPSPPSVTVKTGEVASAPATAAPRPRVIRH